MYLVEHGQVANLTGLREVSIGVKCSFAVLMAGLKSTVYVVNAVDFAPEGANAVVQRLAGQRNDFDGGGRGRALDRAPLRSALILL